MPFSFSVLTLIGAVKVELRNSLRGQQDLHEINAATLHSQDSLNVALIIGMRHWSAGHS